jgi:hypothetical protein
MAIGFYKIVEITNSELEVIAASVCTPEIKGRFLLPPLNRRSTSDIAVGDVFLGVLDDISGVGALLVMTEDGHDFGHYFKYALKVDHDLTVTGDVEGRGAATFYNSIDTTENITALGTLTSSSIDSSAATGAMTLTAVDCAAIVSAAASGAAAEITPSLIKLG